MSTLARVFEPINIGASRSRTASCAPSTTHDSLLARGEINDVLPRTRLLAIREEHTTVRALD